jgi:hypothetical protein
MHRFVELCTQHRDTPSDVPEVLEGWVVRHGPDWRFSPEQALAGGARTRTQYELFCEWRGTFLRTTTIGEEGEWREALEHSGHDLPMTPGSDIESSEALRVAVSAENMRSAYRSLMISGSRVLPDRGGALNGLNRVVMCEEGALRFEEADGLHGPSIVVNGVRYTPGSAVRLFEGAGVAVLQRLFPAAASVQVVEVDIAELWARAWEVVTRHLMWADQKHAHTMVRLKDS